MKIVKVNRMYAIMRNKEFYKVPHTSVKGRIELAIKFFRTEKEASETLKLLKHASND